MKIDDRFPELPLAIKIPLYKKRNIISRIITWIAFLIHSGSKNRDGLKDIIAHNYHVRRMQVHLTSSGSRGLYDLLASWRAVHNDFSRVALPNYSCPELMRVIISLNMTPVIYDFNNWSEPRLSSQNINFDAIIYPNLWGQRTRNRMLIESMKKLKIKVILDDAQSFPSIQRSDTVNFDAVILSFGHSKKLRAGKGGAVVLAQSEMGFFNNNTVVSEEALSLASKIKNVRSRLHQLAKPPQRRYQHLSHFLSDYNFHKAPERQISVMDFFYVWQQYHHYSGCYPQQMRRYKIVKCALAKSFGDDALSALEDIAGLPSALCIHVDSRFVVSQFFAYYGIQTTWYYLPLAEIKANIYFDEVTGFSNSDVTFAARCLILPFYPQLTTTEFLYLLRVIRKWRFIAPANRPVSL